MHYDDPSAIARELIALRSEHRDIDMLIARLQADPHADQFALARMKKRKLRLKDMIGYMENKLIPDLDA
jgi:hypothetical protein